MPVKALNPPDFGIKFTWDWDKPQPCSICENHDVHYKHYFRVTKEHIFLDRTQECSECGMIGDNAICAGNIGVSWVQYWRFENEKVYFRSSFLGRLFWKAK